MATKGKKSFISYWREDAADAAGRICDWLVQTRHVGPGAGHAGAALHTDLRR
jgi:hypothetical protein